MEPDIEESYPRKKILLIFIPPSVELFAKLELHRRDVIIYFIFIQAFTEAFKFYLYPSLFDYDSVSISGSTSRLAVAMTTRMMISTTLPPLYV